MNHRTTRAHLLASFVFVCEQGDCFDVRRVRKHIHRHDLPRLVPGLLPAKTHTHTSAPRTKEHTHLSQRMSVCGAKRDLLEELDVAELRDGIARDVHDGRRAQAHEVLHRVGVHPCRAQHGSQRK